LKTPVCAAGNWSGNFGPALTDDRTLPKPERKRL
jgi:hypothetical protein